MNYIVFTCVYIYIYILCCIETASSTLIFVHFFGTSDYLQIEVEIRSQPSNTHFCGNRVRGERTRKALALRNANPRSSAISHSCHTVDGQNPAPPGMVKTL